MSYNNEPDVNAPFTHKEHFGNGIWARCWNKPRQTGYENNNDNMFSRQIGPVFIQIDASDFKGKITDEMFSDYLDAIEGLSEEIEELNKEWKQ